MPPPVGISTRHRRRRRHADDLLLGAAKGRQAEDRVQDGQGGGGGSRHGTRAAREAPLIAVDQCQDSYKILLLRCPPHQSLAKITAIRIRGSPLRTVYLIILGFWLCLTADPAAAERRVALVVGVSAYKQRPRLTNPKRDSEAMADVFRQAGFDTVDRRDLGIAELRRVVRDFTATVRDADVAVVYYAGHGIEVDGANYLIPADAKLESDFDVEDETLSLERMLKSLDQAGGCASSSSMPAATTRSPSR